MKPLDSFINKLSKMHGRPINNALSLPATRQVWFHFAVWLLSAGMVWGLAFKWLGRSEVELFGGARLYVFRQFVPLIAHGLMAFGLQADQAVIVVVFLMTIGFAYSLRYLYATFWQDSLRGDVVTLLSLEGLFLLIVLEAKFYDVSTAFLFTLALALMARDKLVSYYLLFPLACLNRETTFLLTLVYAVHFWNRLRFRDWIGGVLYQTLVYLLVRLGLMIAFADLQGPAFLFRPVEHLREIINHPWELLAFVVAVPAIIWLALRGWKDKPLFLRTTFMVLAPLMMILFFLFGSGFEIRVFVEMYAASILIMLNPKSSNVTVNNSGSGSSESGR